MKNRGTVVLFFSALTVVLLAATLNAVNAAAIYAYIQSAYASQGPEYITFETLGDCHKYVKQNSDFYEKSDCKKGAPPG